MMTLTSGINISVITNAEPLSDPNPRVGTDYCDPTLTSVSAVYSDQVLLPKLISKVQVARTCNDMESTNILSLASKA